MSRGISVSTKKYQVQRHLLRSKGRAREALCGLVAVLAQPPGVATTPISGKEWVSSGLVAIRGEGFAASRGSHHHGGSETPARVTSP